MEGWILLLLGFLFVIFVLPIIAFVRAGRAVKDGDDLRGRIAELEHEVTSLRRRMASDVGSLEAQAELAALRRAKSTALAAPAAPSPQVAEAPPPELESEAVAAPELEAPVAAPPELKPEPTAEPPPPIEPEPTAEAEPGVEPEPVAEPEPPPPPVSPPAPEPASGFSFSGMKGTLSWEEFMGAKLYGWIGGLSLFLAVAYFIKHSFDRGWLPPVVRVAMGFALGLGLVVSGVVVRQRKYTVLSHTLAATGVLILYVVTFACRAIYHFPFFEAGATFGFMALITATAFVLAVRLNAMAVAVLGMLGGFLTPVLVSTGKDAPVALFGYIALLDVGLIAVCIVRKWRFLSPLAMVGTVLMQFGWMAKFFRAGSYYEDDKVLIPMAVLLGFNLLWLGAARVVRDRPEDQRWFSGAAIGLALSSFLAAFYFHTFNSIAERPFVLLGFVVGLDLVTLALARVDRERKEIHPLAGALVFVFLSLWLGTQVDNKLLPPALLFTLLFALLHTVVPLALARIDGDEHRPPVWLMAFPPLALGALLIPVFRLAELSIWIWPVIFLVDLLAIGLAAVTLSLWSVLLTLLLTLLAAAGLVLELSTALTGLSTVLVLIAATSVLFAAAGLWLGGKLGALSAPPTTEKAPAGAITKLLPSFAVVLPFLLLVIIVGRLPLTSPTPVFGLALLLVVMLLALSRMLQLSWLPLIGLLCVVSLEHVWQMSLPKTPEALSTLAWYGVFFAAFAVFPFLFHRDLGASTGPWVASALAGPAQFYLVHRLIERTWPTAAMGLLGVVFALPSLLSLVMVVKKTPEDAQTRQTQLALYGGVALFFITLIFPLQFSRQWITISWAIEGAALCWLFIRVPHPGLRLTGVALLGTAFARLALNPAVLRYHARSEWPILNWYLYSYGLVIIALFAAAHWLAPPRDRIRGRSVVGALRAFAVVLAFLLLNLQIADFFTEPGARVLAFEFSGNFARDMSYSIAWGLFALGLLVAGIMKSLRSARYAALALLGVTMLKLFFHDLAQLDALYRVGALVSLAVVALAASFLYQKFNQSQTGAHEAETAKPENS